MFVTSDDWTSLPFLTDQFPSVAFSQYFEKFSAFVNVSFPKIFPVSFDTTFALSNFAAVFHVPTPTFPANGFDATAAPDISDLRSVVPAFLANIF